MKPFKNISFDVRAIFATTVTVKIYTKCKGSFADMFKIKDTAAWLRKKCPMKKAAVYEEEMSHNRHYF